MPKRTGLPQVRGLTVTPTRSGKCAFYHAVNARGTGHGVHSFFGGASSKRRAAGSLR